MRFHFENAFFYVKKIFVVTIEKLHRLIKKQTHFTWKPYFL